MRRGLVSTAKKLDTFHNELMYWSRDNQIPHRNSIYHSSDYEQKDLLGFNDIQNYMVLQLKDRIVLYINEVFNIQNCIHFHKEQDKNLLPLSAVHLLTYLRSDEYF